MARSVRLQKKLHALHLLEAAENVVLDDRLVEKLWALNQGAKLELNATSAGPGVVQKYRLEYVLTRGPILGHWLYKDFDSSELELFFTAKYFDHICRGWLLFDE